MAQFVTHIQPTLIEASHHHIPHPHHHKEHHEKHDKHHKEHEKQHKEYDKHHKELEKYKEVIEHQQCSKDHSLKEKLSSKIYLPVVGHSTQHYPILPATPSHHHFDEHAEQEHKRDSGQYLDSHGIPHTYQLHFIDSQGIHRDFHGHVEDSQERPCEQYLQDHQEKESHYEKLEYNMDTEEVFIRKAVPEDRSPYDKSPFRDDKKPIPPRFINLNAPENKYQTSDGNTSFLRAARNGQLDKVLEHLKSNIDINTSNANGLNALHLASKDGHVEIVKELLKRGALVDSATKKGNTALHIASLAGQEEVVKLLVQNGATVNVQSQNGFTPLYMAAQENHDNVVRYLLANGANQSLSTEDGFTPLAVAMQQGHDKVVTVLLENDTRGKVRLPALHIAAKKDDVKAAKLLLENEHNPDVTSKSGFTPLHIASHYGNQKIAKLLVQKGADVNYAAKHNITPLHVAAKWGKSNMVALLLENGATIEAKTRDGLTPLHCAARSGHEQVVDMLLEKEAPISSKTKNGLAPLHMAAQGDHVDAARILLYHRAPVDEVTVDYLTALHVAAHCGHVRVAKLLLDRQADANARALNGFTPLHIACKKNRIKVVELLLKHGASIGATTESGLTPLHVASFMGCMNIVIYLLQHDANPDAPTIRGETPLHLAARANQTDIIRILLRNGAQVDARAREQQTPLHIASRLGNVDIVMLLLQHGSKVDNATKDMYTALHIAAKEGQDEVASVLIDNGASINSTTKKGFTPLHLASKYGHLKVAKLLLQKEAPVDAQGKNGVTPLHVASHYDHQNVALLLLDKGASPHATAKNGHTPLHIAARKNQMDIANTLLEYGAQPNAESKAGFTPLHLSSQEGHVDISSLLLEHKADPNHEAKNGLAPLHLCAQEDKVPVAEVLVKNGAHVDAATKAGYTPLHIACHYGQTNMVRFLLRNGAEVKSSTSLGYTPLHQAAQQGHTNIVNILLESNADPNAMTSTGQTPLNIAQKLGYITVIESLKLVTTITNITTSTTTTIEEKYRVQAPEAMQETFMSDSEEEGGEDIEGFGTALHERHVYLPYFNGSTLQMREDAALGDQTYRYLTADEMKSLGDDSLPIDVTRDERMDSNKMIIDSNMLPPQHIEDSISPEHISGNYTEYIKKYTSDNIDINRHPINIGFLVSFLVDARGGAMRGCRHSGVRVIVPPRCAPSPTRITCRYVRPQRTPHPPPLMEGEALASRVLELGPVGAQFLGPVIIEVPHFAALRGKEREIVILRSDNGESWKEHTVKAAEDILNEVLHESFEAEDLNQMEDVASGRITRIVTQDFPQYFAVVSRIRQEVHAIGPEGGMVSSSVVPQVQAIFPEGALTKKIKVGLQAQPIDPELTAKLLGHGVAVSPVVTVEPRRRKFHRAIQLNMPAPTAHSQGMINQYSGSAPTLRLLCSITGGTSRAQWEDVTGSTPLTFVNDVVSFTTTVSARFWLIDCRNISDATKMATELYKEAIHVPFMAKFVVFAKRVDPLEARLRVFCMTDDKEDKTLEHQEHFTEVAKSRDVEVLEGKSQYIEFAGNLVPITKSGEQLQFSFRAFRENRLPFSVRVKDQHAEAVGRCLFMREAKILKGEPPQQPICILNIVLPDDIVTDTISLTDSESGKRHMYLSEFQDYYRPDPRLADMSNLLGDDWVELAYQLGLTSSEINVIKSEYPESIAKQAQSMLRMWLSQSGNKAQTNTLENALRRIGREDIIPQCLNVEQPTHTFTRIKEQEIGYRLKKKDENDLPDKKKIEHFDKYSAEEKVVVKSESEEEDNFDKTVTERREQIQKRLSAERAIPASSQRREIVQEICDIKRQSLVEDKIAEVLQKVEPETQTKAVRTQISETTELKTTLPSNSVASETTTTIVESHRIVEDTAAHKPGEDARFLEEVSSRFEGPQVKIEQRVSSNDDPKSPNFSKTPPPSPADFLNQRQVASAQGEFVCFSLVCS
uniref:Death domain-containing protein n=1 Tax=Dendroctonus ponderosae TaxID=77166 RepID=A0AAR5P4H9_DENPD